MKDQILQKLSEVEHEKGIEILFAVESGSRAWGFPSPDSDYDIRFVYKHNMDHYLRLDEPRDTIEFMTEQDFDGSGWDFRKASRLLKKSNASFLDWLFSPVVYRANQAFLEEMQKIAQDCFSPIAVLHHHHSMSKRFVEQLDVETIKLKSLFYALRAVLSATWVLEMNTIPPVAFLELLPVLKKQDTREKILSLIDLKKKKDESYFHPIEKDLKTLIKQHVQFNEENSQKLSGSKVLMSDLNTFFLKWIKDQT